MASEGLAKLMTLLQAHTTPELQGKLIGAFAGAQAMAQAGLAYQAMAALDPVLGQLAEELDAKLSTYSHEAAQDLAAASVAPVEPAQPVENQSGGNAGAAGEPFVQNPV